MTVTAVANGACPDCDTPQEVGGSITRCSNEECALVAPTSAFRLPNRGDDFMQSGESRAWTMGGEVD